MRRPYQDYRRPFQDPPKPKRDRKKYLLWLASFGVLYVATEKLLANYTEMLVEGLIDPSGWGAKALATISHAHSMAYVYGAQSMGGNVTPTEAEGLLQTTLQDQAEFLYGFVLDLESGDERYLYNPNIDPKIPDTIFAPPPIEDEENPYWDEKAINQRLFLYNERTRGTANWAAVDMLHPSEKIYWIDDPSESECDVCKWRSTVTWYKGTLPGVPGDGSTPCLVHCKCHLELADGTIIQF
jgi:hypothetical protein